MTSGILYGKSVQARHVHPDFAKPGAGYDSLAVFKSQKVAGEEVLMIC